MQQLFFVSKALKWPRHVWEIKISLPPPLPPLSDFQAIFYWVPVWTFSGTKQSESHVRNAIFI